MGNRLLFSDECRFRYINGEMYRSVRSRDNNPSTGEEWVSVWVDKMVWRPDPATVSGQNYRWIRVHTWGPGAYFSEAHHEPTYTE